MIGHGRDRPLGFRVRFVVSFGTSSGISNGHRRVESKGPNPAPEAQGLVNMQGLAAASLGKPRDVPQDELPAIAPQFVGKATFRGHLLGRCGHRIGPRGLQHRRLAARGRPSVGSGPCDGTSGARLCEDHGRKSTSWCLRCIGEKWELKNPNRVKHPSCSFDGRKGQSFHLHVCDVDVHSGGLVRITLAWRRMLGTTTLQISSAKHSATDVAMGSIDQE